MGHGMIGNILHRSIKYFINQRCQVQVLPSFDPKSFWMENDEQSQNLAFWMEKQNSQFWMKLDEKWANGQLIAGKNCQTLSHSPI